MTSSAATRLTASMTLSLSSWIGSAKTVSALIPTLFSHRRSSSVFPFDRAAHAGNLVHRALAGAGNLRHRLEQVAACIWHRARARGIEPAAVLQLQIGVEAEEVGRANRVIRASDLLALVPKIGKRKTQILCHALHVVE